MPINFGGAGVTPNPGSQQNALISLAAGSVYSVPAGRWAIKPGKYTNFQEYDPVLQSWRRVGAGSTGAPLEIVFSDGFNYRLANQTGCAVGALITAAGSGYTSVPTVTASAGSSIWRAIVGGAVSTTVTISNSGLNYTYPPTVIFSPPPPGGIQADGYSTLSSGGVASVTVTDQGAGYTSPPTITFVNDPREGQNGVSQGYNAAAVASLTGSGTITGLICIDHGLPGTYSATSALPTLSFSGGGGSGAAATILMDLTITSFALSATTVGSGITTPVIISAYGGFPATAPAYTNPTTQSGLVLGRNAFITATISGTGLTTGGQTVSDGGIYPGFPTTYVAVSGPYGAGAVAPVFLSPNMGGVADTSYVFPT